MHNGEPFKCLYALGSFDDKYGNPQYSGAYFYRQTADDIEMVVCKKVFHSDEQTDMIVEDIRKACQRGWGVPLVVIDDRNGTALIYEDFPEPLRPGVYGPLGLATHVFEQYMPPVKAADAKYPPPKPRRKKRSRKARKKGKK